MGRALVFPFISWVIVGWNYISILTIFDCSCNIPTDIVDFERKLFLAVITIILDEEHDLAVRPTWREMVKMKNILLCTWDATAYIKLCTWKAGKAGRPSIFLVFNVRMTWQNFYDRRMRDNYSGFRLFFKELMVFDSSTCFPHWFRLFENCSFVKSGDITIPLVDFRRVFTRDMLFAVNLVVTQCVPGF
jgi:hypothetical protein